MVDGIVSSERDYRLQNIPSLWLWTLVSPSLLKTAAEIHSHNSNNSQNKAFVLLFFFFSQGSDLLAVDSSIKLSLLQEWCLKKWLQRICPWPTNVRSILSEHHSVWAPFSSLAPMWITLVSQLLWLHSVHFKGKCCLAIFEVFMLFFTAGSLPLQRNHFSRPTGSYLLTACSFM